MSESISKKAADVAENMHKVFLAGAYANNNTNIKVTADWNAQEGEDGYIKNRTHYIDKDGNYVTLDPRFIADEQRADKLPMFDMAFETTDGEFKTYKVYGFEVV